MKKTAVRIIIIVFITVIILLSYGGYYYFKKAKSAKESNSNLENQIDDLNNQIDKLSNNNINNVNNNENDANDVKEDIQGSTWLTYTNSKFGYKFKYPSDYSKEGCSSKPCGKFISEEQGGSILIMQGDLSQAGWPNITISHLETEFYNPSEGVDLREWILDAFPNYQDYISLNSNYSINTSGTEVFQGYEITTPQSPQAYSEKIIYFIDADNRLFTINLTDYASYSKNFYDKWLEEFIF